MNDKVLPRLVKPALEEALASAPVVVLTGARQSGKTTLARSLGGERAYVTLDDLEMLARARAEPDALVRLAERVTLDEVQRAPELLLAVKRAVDEGRRPGRFVLTGSANLLLMKHVSETLAGRAAHFTLWPMTRREQSGLGAAGIWSALWKTPDAEWKERIEAEQAPEEDWRALARRGGYPTPAHELEDGRARALWHAGYTQTYLERDLRDLSEVASLVDFRRLMRAACLRLGTIVNQTELGRDVGLSQPTVHRHLSLLETSYQLVRVPAYSVNRTKRLVKSPKLYWSDTGLAMHLAGEAEPRGPHLENVVLGDLLAWRSSELEPPEILYWRSVAGEEVDFVVEWQGRLLPMEVKASARPRLADSKHLASFRREYADISRPGLLLHTGSEISWLSDGILAAPWWKVF